MALQSRLTYPSSRIGKPYCPMCNKNHGLMIDSGRLKLPDAAGNTVEFMKLTCNRCGYTILFDLDIPRNRPLGYDPHHSEVIPE